MMEGSNNVTKEKVIQRKITKVEEVNHLQEQKSDARLWTNTPKINLGRGMSKMTLDGTRMKRMKTSHSTPCSHNGKQEMGGKQIAILHITPMKSDVAQWTQGIVPLGQRKNGVITLVPHLE